MIHMQCTKCLLEHKDRVGLLRTSELPQSSLIFYSSHATFLTQRKRSYEISVRSNIDDRLTDRPTDQPTNDRPQGPFTHFAKISNGRNSATRQPIPFMFGSRVGFSETADPTAPFPVGPNSRWRPAAISENFKWPHLSNVLSDSLYVCIQTIL